MFKRVTAIDGIYPPLFSRYVEQEAGVVAFFNGDFWDKECYDRRAFFLQGYSFPPELRELLVEINSGLPLQPAAGWEQKVRNRQTLFVITGQQPGIFAGPLLVLYKALAAIKLAQRLEGLLQVPVQPLFWVASEDHNAPPLLRSYAPVDRGIMRMGLPQPREKLPVGRLIFDAELMDELLQQLSSFDQAGGNREDVMQWLRSTLLAAENNLSGWFMQIMSHLCAAAGLLLFDPLQAAAKGLYIPLLLQALELTGSMHECVAKAEAALQACKFPLQVKRRGQETFIMISWGKKRYSLLREGDHYYTPGGELSLSRNELLALIVQQPSLFSPGVLLRPLFQDSLFPTLAYVPGPAELAYFAQIKGLYPLYQMELPPLFPRPGVTLLEPALLQAAAQHNLKLHTPAGLLQAKEGPHLLREHIWPNSCLQERSFNIITYLLVYGFEFWQAFCRDFPGDPGHYLYYLKEGGS